MSTGSEETAVDDLEPLLGEWRMEAVFASGSPAADLEQEGVARTEFEWLPGRRLLLQRWEVPHPEAPDGIAVIGWDAGRDSYLQHYFDSRGVVRVYEMSLGAGVWKLSRTAADFSPLDFAQRYSGTFSDGGSVIRGSWETSSDGSRWEHDFELNYRRID